MLEVVSKYGKHNIQIKHYISLKFLLVRHVAENENWRGSHCRQSDPPNWGTGVIKLILTSIHTEIMQILFFRFTINRRPMFVSSPASLERPAKQVNFLKIFQECFNPRVVLRRAPKSKASEGIFAQHIGSNTKIASSLITLCDKVDPLRLLGHIPQMYFLRHCVVLWNTSPSRCRKTQVLIFQQLTSTFRNLRAAQKGTIGNRCERLNENGAVV